MELFLTLWKQTKILQIFQDAYADVEAHSNSPVACVALNRNGNMVSYFGTFDSQNILIKALHCLYALVGEIKCIYLFYLLLISVARVHSAFS